MALKNYKFDNPETLAQDLDVITEDVPMLIEVDISRKVTGVTNGTSW